MKTKSTWLPRTLLTLGCFVSIASAQVILRTNVVQWQTVSPYEFSNGYSVAFGNGRFVGHDAVNLSYSMDDGLTWRMGGGYEAPVSSTPLDQKYFKKVIFGGGHFIAIAGDGQASASSDGIFWKTRRVFPTIIHDIAFGDGRFVAVGGGGGIATSTDGDQWIMAPAVTTNSLAAITYGNGKFLATAIGGISGNPPSRSIQFAECPAGNFGYSWTIRAGPIFYQDADCQTNGCPVADGIGSQMAFSQGNFVLVGSSSSTPWIGATIFRSSDGILWIPGERFFPAGNPDISPGGNFLRNLNGVLTYHTIEFGNGTYVKIGSSIRRGSTLDSLTNPIPTLEPMILSSVASHGDTIVGVGSINNGRAILLSTNGAKTFEIQSNSVPSILRKVIHAGGKFVGVGDNGLIAESLNGLHWTQRPSNTTSNLNDIAVESGRWVVVGNGILLSSSDGLQFGPANLSITNNCSSVTFGDGQFVVAAYDTILTSTNGLNWLTIPITPPVIDVAYGNGRFVAGSNISLDGKTWSPITQFIWNVEFLKGKFYSSFPGYIIPSPLLISTNGLDWSTYGFPSIQLQASNGTLWGIANSSKPSLWRPATAIHLQATAAGAGKVYMQLEVPAPGRYRLLKSGSPSGPWDPGDVLDIGYITGWDELPVDTNARFVRAAKE